MTDSSSKEGATTTVRARLRNLLNAAFSRTKTAQQEAPAPDDGKKRRTAPLWGTVTTGTVALLLGVSIGAGSSSNAIDPQEHDDLKQQLESTASELKEQKEAHEEAVAKLAEDRDEIAEQLATSKKELATTKKEVAKAVDEKTQAVAAQLEAVDLKEAAEQREAEATARATAAEAVANSAPQQFASTPEPAATTPTYFQNCTAARAAGAAPVYRGDPGYGPHLDRDGDGIGCE
ncbi:excalibur calcium-binding domain-containing protein [Leucobacter chinensis]|uniref:excalibur calcium-binding domain-containing protein n=1 Tax=Leucobacter chinensis TaxID=2851010 RepID=UPI0020B715ED|nr:excalibur calcium-binding domain-containing protein [Leucobacter chinensis]